ncbi:MAG TPA: alpha/beta fold hydrolase [Myxococcaceae bacterium]|nr:alpha/beta fold hydrolase [Myxococcaceae bacterium]
MNLLATVQGYVRRRLIAAGVGSDLHLVAGHAVHAYRVAGTGVGPPVLLVHGLGGSANGWVRVLRPLARDFSAVYAVDLPGNGFSPLPASGPLTLEEQLSVLHAFCREVVKAPAFVVGNSLGGALSVILGAVHPEDVVALGLVSPAGGQMSPESMAELMRVLDVRTTADAVRLTRRLFHRAPLVAILFAPELKKMHATPAVRALRTHAQQRHHIPPDLIAGLRAPTLLLWGASEKLLPREQLDWYRAHLPSGARIEVVPGFGHVPQMERPRELVQRLRGFAEELGLLAVSPRAPVEAPAPS